MIGKKIFFYTGIFSSQVWLGSGLFLSLVLAPTLFMSFGVELAADVLSVIFPIYGILLLTCILLGTAGWLVFWPQRKVFGRKTYFGGLAILGNCLIAGAIQAMYVFPRVKGLRAIVKAARAEQNIDRVADQAAELMRLHSTSVAINNFMLLGSVLLVIFNIRILRELGKTKL